MARENNSIDDDSRKQHETATVPTTLEEVKAEKLTGTYAELDVIDRKIARPLAELVAGNPSDEDKAKFNELMVRKHELRAIIAQINAAETIEELRAIDCAINCVY